MKTVVPDAQLGQLTVTQIQVGELNAGPIQVGRLVLNDTRTAVQTGAAAFSNLRVELRLELTLRWKITIDLGFFERTWDGSIPFGVQTPMIRVGDLTLPGLQRFDLGLASVSVEQLEATVGPLRDLTLSGLTAEQVRVADMTAPVQDFTITGLGLGGASLEGLNLPDASVGAVTIARLRGLAVPMDSVTIPDIALPAANAGRIVGEGLDTDAESNPIDLTADAGILEVTLELVPGVRLLADQLILDGVNLALSVGSLELHDVVLPYEVLNLTLSQLGIQTVDVPKIQVT
ncbi:hypothetical protein JOD57_003897 [Geodermatophilus bullaregiensis]|uniref:hypothetical protein n=1 Tax=Geodermatophilus bullaregiensis TaxID=1564160 RepID=UPI00195A60E7|nr:hypothetical protein [Geodermatophilus bullaregiensis]MBM7808060.1 hypothetical protein [Geodermatophilus bullaregiensis]